MGKRDVGRDINGRSPLQRHFRRYWQLYLMMVVPVVYFIVFKYIPMIGNVLAFRKYRPGKGIFGTEWVGFRYFKRFFEDPAFMDSVLEEKKADFVVVGRQFIADPDWPKKAKRGNADEISKCIRCETCISAGFIPHVPFSSGVLRCSVNPKWGREYENTRKEEPVEKKKILIAGGGPAGMEAALTAAQRGHEVILCEKNDHLAGNLDYSKQIEFKKDIVEFLKSMVIRVQREKNIDLRLDTEVNEELIKQEKPDVVMVACGSEPIIPPIPGLDKPMVHHITDLYKKHISVGEKIVIIGGGLAGCE